MRSAACCGVILPLSTCELTFHSSFSMLGSPRLMICALRRIVDLHCRRQPTIWRATGFCPSIGNLDSEKKPVALFVYRSANSLDAIHSRKTLASALFLLAVLMP